MQSTDACSRFGCTREVHARCLCKLHYKQARERGELELHSRTRVSGSAERLERYLVRMPSGCIEWSASRFAQGYGQIKIDGKNRKTHRVAWELVNGPIPDGLMVCHRCDNPPCCNLDHLFLGTAADNTHDMQAKGRRPDRNGAKTHCPRAHEYTTENIRITSAGGRVCRTCERERLRSRRGN